MQALAFNSGCEPHGCFDNVDDKTARSLICYSTSCRKSKILSVSLERILHEKRVENAGIKKTSE